MTPINKEREESGKAEVVNLRIPATMLAEVDVSVKSRRLPTPRHRWLLEAIDEKLQRERDAADVRAAEDELQAIRDGSSRTYALEDVMREHGNLER